MRVDRKVFWKSYRDAFGPIASPKTVAGLNAILDKLETETRIPTLEATAYVIATAKHESGHSENGTWVEYQPVKEVKASKARNPDIWKLQQRYWGTGFFGRGLIQTTWEDNYRKLGQLLGVGELFVENPDLLLEPKWAYEALVIGMVKGIYRPPHKLSKYFHKTVGRGTRMDYVNAREIVNGDVRKNGRKIANDAEAIARVLKSSSVADDESQVSDKGAGDVAGVLLPALTDTGPSVEVKHADNVTAAPQPVKGGSPDDPPQEVAQTKSSFVTRAAATIAAIVTPLSAAGIKLGGFSISTGAIYAMCAFGIVGLLVGAWMWNKSADRAARLTELQLLNRARPQEINVELKQ